MANPQKENGYVGIANELFEAICNARFTGRQYAVLLSVIRLTYGYNHKKSPISVRELSHMTGITHSHISETVSELIEKSVMIEYGVHGQTRILGINKNYDEWIGVPKTGTGVFPKQERYRSRNRNTSVHKTGTHTIKRQYKDNKDRHSDDFLALWELYPEKKRDGLEFVSAEAEREVLDNIERVKSALEEYLASVNDEKYLVKAEKFFNGKWKAYAEDESEPKKRKGRFQ